MALSLNQLPPGLLAMFGPPAVAGANGNAPVDPSAPLVTPPIRMGPGGKNLNPPAPGTQFMPPEVAPADVTAGRGSAFGPPKSSDDPGITGMPALPTPPDISKSPVGPVNAQYQADVAKRAAFGPAPNPADYKPSLGRRIGGGLLGALSGGLASAAGEKPEDAVKTGEAAGGAFTNRAFNRAQGTYARGTSALDKQLEAERGGFPIAEAAGKLPQEDFTNKLNLAKEGREQQVGQGRIDAAESRSTQADAKAQQLQDLIDHPKTTTPKNADEALAQAYLETDPAKRSTLMDMATALHKQEIERAQQSRPDSGQKPATRNQFREVDDRRKKADDDAEKEFQKETADFDLTQPHNASGQNPEEDRIYAQRKATYDQTVQRLNDKKKRNEEAYYEDIRDLGGSAPGGPAKAGVRSTPVTSAKGPDGNTYKVGDIIPLKGKGNVKITKLFSNGDLEYAPVSK